MNTKSLSKERPAFLTVLCIISYVGLGMKILNSISGAIFGLYASYFETFIRDFVNQNIVFNEIPENVRYFIIDSLRIFYKAMEHATSMSLLTLVLSVAALFGVIMMWQLKKAGFYLYTGSKVFTILVPVIFLGFNLFTVIAVTSAGSFALIFIVLYAVNLKHMN